MSDPRLARLGELIVGYSIGLQPDQVIRIDVPTVATPLAEALYRASLRAGVSPSASVELESRPEILAGGGGGAQLDFVSRGAETEIDRIDAIVTIWAERNTRAFPGADPARHQRLIAASRALTNRR